MGRVAVVTGGASGIGLAIVRRLAAGGASVALLDLDAAAADQAAAELRGEGSRVIGLGADVADRAAVEKGARRRLHHRPGHRRERRQLHLRRDRSADRDSSSTSQSKVLIGIVAAC